MMSNYYAIRMSNGELDQCPCCAGPSLYGSREDVAAMIGDGDTIVKVELTVRPMPGKWRPGGDGNWWIRVRPFREGGSFVSTLQGVYTTMEACQAACDELNAKEAQSG